MNPRDEIRAAIDELNHRGFVKAVFGWRLFFTIRAR